jgi:hypothetical protein
MRGKRLISIGAGLTLCAGSACSLLTKLDPPTGDSPKDTGAPGGEDAGIDGSHPSDDAGGEGAASNVDSCAADAAPPYYAAQYVDQSFPFATDALIMVEGEILPSYITLKNVGTTPWDTSTQLGTTAARNRTSPFADGNWLSPSRAAAVKGTVPVNGTFKFQFDLQAPMTAGGPLFEHFGLLDDGLWHCTDPVHTIWFGDPGQGGPADTDIEVQILVIAPQFRGTFLSQSFPLAPAKGSVVTGNFQLTNTGTQPWVAGTTLLAPIPRDVGSPFADPSWVSPTRISSVAADVPPGDVGEFLVTLDAKQAGTFKLKFGLVEEGVTWFADPTLGGGPPDGFLEVDLAVDVLDAGTD